jgi:carbon monoxide dehydrogenase subunit G
MEVEKYMIVNAPVQEVWDFLLDPGRMASCVPGTQSVEVISETEYLAVVKVKISFISATFKVRTKVLEINAPHYLRCEGTGEDSRVASSVKQETELFVTDLGNGETEIRFNGKAQVFGKLGSFGLSVMKTKVDRMWSEFGDALKARLAPA